MLSESRFGLRSLAIFLLFLLLHRTNVQSKTQLRSCYACNYTCDDSNITHIICEEPKAMCFLMLGGDDDEIEYRGCIDSSIADCKEMKIHYNVSFCFLCNANFCNSAQVIQDAIGSIILAFITYLCR